MGDPVNNVRPCVCMCVWRLCAKLYRKYGTAFWAGTGLMTSRVASREYPVSCLAHLRPVFGVVSDGGDNRRRRRRRRQRHRALKRALHTRAPKSAATRVGKSMRDSCGHTFRFEYVYYSTSKHHLSQLVLLIKIAIHHIWVSRARARSASSRCSIS